MKTVYPHSMLAAVAAELIELYSQYQGDPDDLLLAAGVNGGMHPWGADHADKQSRAVLCALIPEVVAATARAANARNGHLPMTANDWRMLVFCLTGSRTLREAIHRCSDFMAVLNGRFGHLSLRVLGSESRIKFGRRFTEPDPLDAAVDLFGIINIHALLCWLVRHPSLDGKPRLASPMDSLAPAFHSLLPSSTVYAAGWTGFAFPTRFLDLPVLRDASDLDQRDILEFAFAPQSQKQALPIEQQARAIMMRALRQQHTILTLDQLSIALELPNSTMRRKLDKAGASYSQLKDSCRRELALELLGRTDTSIEDISERLAYCDSDAFRQAFKLWMGIAPSTYRTQTRQRMQS